MFFVLLVFCHFVISREIVEFMESELIFMKFHKIIHEDINKSKKRDGRVVQLLRFTLSIIGLFLCFDRTY